MSFLGIPGEIFSNITVFYIISLFALILIVRSRHASVHKERIARDPYYRTLIATKSHGRKRDSRSTKNRYTFKDPQVNILLKKSYKKRKMKKLSRYVFFPLLMMAIVSLQVYPAITIYLLIIAWSIAYVSNIHWDARLLEKAYRKGVQNGVSLKDYEMYVRQVNHTLSEEIK